MKVLLLVVLFIVSCDKRAKDQDVVLITQSMFGSIAHIATFNGNNFDSKKDCEFVAAVLNEKSSQNYVCVDYRSIKFDVKY